MIKITIITFPSAPKENLVTEVDPTAVYLITSVDTCPVFQLACLVKYLLNELPESKLVPCVEANQAMIKVRTGTYSTITIVSYSPVTKLHISSIDQAIYSSVVSVCQKIAENCNTSIPNAETCTIGRPKYKFVMICAKNRVFHAKDIPSCQYHVLPSDTLCDKCVIPERVNDQLQAWNEALKKVSN